MSGTIVIIGAGKVGLQLAVALSHRKYRVQLFNRSAIPSLDRSESDSISPVHKWSDILTDADAYIISVSDDAITTVVDRLSLHLHKDSIIAHTSGTRSLDDLTKKFKHCGVFYPLQSFTNYRKLPFKEVPILITTNDPIAHEILRSVASDITDQVSFVTDEERSLLHVPAVMVNNFTNHLYALAYDYCHLHGLDPSLLYPLIRETSQRLQYDLHPRELQTGPAVRKDIRTIKKHLDTLVSTPSIRRLYRYITQHIRTYHEDHTHL